MNLRENTTSWRESPLNTKTYESLKLDETSSTATKSVLENMLSNGVIIQNERSYNALRGLMKKYFQIPLCDFNKVTEGFGGPSGDIDASGKKNGFRLAWKSGEDVVVYPDDTGLFSGQSGYIRDGKFVPGSIPPTSLNYTGNDRLFDIPEKQESPKNIPTVSKYTIRKGDTLWKIIKKQYGLTDPNDIANMVNALVRANKNLKQYGVELHQKGTIQANFIREGNVLILPPDMHIKRRIPRKREVQRVDTIER